MKSGPFTTRKRAINSLKLKLMFILITDSAMA